MAKSFFKMTDLELLAWGKDISEGLVEQPAAYFVTPGQAAQLRAAYLGYAARLKAWVDPRTRTPIAMTEKAAAREGFLAAARFIVAMLRNNPAITAVQLQSLGIPQRKRPTTVPPPSTAPRIGVQRVDGCRVTLTLRGEAAGRRGRPEGTAAATLFTATGDAPPEEAAGWSYAGAVSKTRVVLTFPGSAAAGTVWVSARWLNDRGERGPSSLPTKINLPAVDMAPNIEFATVTTLHLAA